MLREFLNVATEDDFMLLIAWLVATYREQGPFPMLVLHGEQGSAKSTTARVLRDLVDPNAASLRAEPMEARHLMISANNGWVAAFDNISRIPGWLSDALCRLATGGGFAARTLYTDREETIFDAQRPALMTGIEELVVRGDLLDRAIIISLPRIPTSARQTESLFYRRFHAVRPLILGALLDAVSCALRNVTGVRLDRIPRMADFAVWIEAASPALGWKSGAFLDAYEHNRRTASDVVLEAPVVEPLRKIALPWTGTATELLNELDRLACNRARRAKSWPRPGRCRTCFAAWLLILGRWAPTLSSLASLTRGID